MLKARKIIIVIIIQRHKENREFGYQVFETAKNAGNLRNLIKTQAIWTSQGK